MLVNILIYYAHCTVIITYKHFITTDYISAIIAVQKIEMQTSDRFSSYFNKSGQILIIMPQTLTITKSPFNCTFFHQIHEKTQTQPKLVNGMAGKNLGFLQKVFRFLKVF